MFSLASGIYQSYFAPPKLSILIIGLDNSGKTALLERIKVTNFSTSSSTITNTTRTRIHNVNTNSSLSVEKNNGNDKQLVGFAVAGALDGEVIKRGARPARLPPPLPPKKAKESKRQVDELLDNERRREQKEGDDRSDLLRGIPPPPLCGLDASERSSDGNNGGAATNDATTASNNSRPPLPPGLSKPNAPSTTTSATPTTTSITTPSKRNSFIQLLRCPSPQRYSSAMDEEDDDDNYHAQQQAIHASALSAICTSAQKKLLLNDENEWNTDYLNDYFINYSETEEFHVKTLNNGKEARIFPLERIRPTLGQNLAKVDISGCKCSLFDLSGDAKMRPLWERYYRDTDAIIYVIDASDDSLENVQQSRKEFVSFCQNPVIQNRLERGLPLLIFANKLDLAYGEYDRAVEKANEVDRKRQVSWNSEEEDAFVGNMSQLQTVEEKTDEEDDISKRALDFYDLLRLFGITPSQEGIGDEDNNNITIGISDNAAQCNGNNSNPTSSRDNNVFLFGGSAKSGEGVKSAIEYLVIQSKNYRLSVNSQ